MEQHTDARRTFLSPIKNDNARLDSTLSNKDATEYDIDYFKKYDEYLNATLFFVRPPPRAPVAYLTCPRRWGCSPPLVWLS